MEITPNEIESVEEIGMLNNEPVKMLRTRGGFHLAVGKQKNKKKDEILAAGNHPAVVKFNLEKNNPEFKPAMLKSELSIDNQVVNDHNHFLSKEQLSSGHEIFSVQDGIKIEFQLIKNDIRLSSTIGVLEQNELVIKNINISQEFSKALAGAIAEKALVCGIHKVTVEEK